jgi:hypothetical protein
MVFYLCLLRAKSSTGQKCNADKSAKIKDFYQSALCIRAIVSTWLEPLGLMSLVGFLTLRSREHINGFLAFFPKTTFKETNRPTITPVFYILHIV